MAPALLDGLDADQRQAVTTPSRLVAVIAGAGSGKTRVLTHRVAHRILEGTADARHTLVLTFTREAAGELRRRLPRLGLRERIEAGTFHAVMLGVLRQHWTDSGMSQPTILADRHRLLREVAGRREIDVIGPEIDRACASGCPPESAAARRLLEEYTSLKRRRGLIDLDDVLVMAADLLENNQQFAEIAAWRYRHVLVDEAQDLNPVQHRLIELLRRGHDDLFLVGDPAQAIYGFNGADPRFLDAISDRLQGVEIIRLAINHRCSPQVVDIGRHVLAVGAAVVTSTASSAPDGPVVRIEISDDEHHEADRVGTWLGRLDPEIIRSGRAAVLARTHAQLDILRNHLTDIGIATRGATTGAASPHRSAIDAAGACTTPTALRVWAHDTLDALEGGPAERPDASALVEVATAALDYLREHPRGDGHGFRTWVATTDPFGNREPTGVELLTFHAAKGREWEAVAVTGVESGLVPHRSATTNESRSEEARLLYVALTRAERHLLVTSAARRHGYRRRPSTLIAGFEPDPEEPAAPPESIRRIASPPGRRSPRLALERWRSDTARTAGILPEQLCSDSVLRAIVERRPTSAEELAALTGSGSITAARWFPEISAALAATEDQSSRSTTTGA